MATTTATATAATYERNNSASSLSDDEDNNKDKDKAEDAVVNVENNDAVITATTTAIMYESILPPVTDEIKREYELEQQLKKDHHHSNDNDSDANDENDENSNSKHQQQQQQQGNSNQGSSKQDCGFFKLLFSHTIWGIPTLMWILCLIFAITVIVYAIITATYYNPSIEDDPVQPPYYSPGGTLYPTIYIEN